ncbi:MAG: hypothetical protein A2283_01305 [Lentisphaerae bacterium RIFOXYA12_FULL_48_11]|nr:MAG: hypothetical protein A2283_01305 [Lentisphaerae bacterium RIFOXYA12_FULL_48_11]
MKKRHAFTLTEVMIAAAITTLVLASVCALLIGMLRTWNAYSANLDLSIQSRLLRERLLHGIQGEFGLRHADRNSIIYATNYLQFQDSESSDHFIIIFQTNQPLRIQNAAGSNVFSTHSDILLKSSAVTLASNVLIMDLVLSINDGRKIWTQSQQIRTYLLND